MESSVPARYLCKGRELAASMQLLGMRSAGGEKGVGDGGGGGGGGAGRGGGGGGGGGWEWE